MWISGQFLIKVNCHNSRASDDIDMKLGPVTKLDKRNKTTSRNIFLKLYILYTIYTIYIYETIYISETIFVCVLTYQISSFYHNSNEF